jgi:hypothetical protein
MRAEQIELITIDKVIAAMAVLLSVGCIVSMAVINSCYPYARTNDTLLATPSYIHEINNVIGFIVLLGLPFVLLVVILNAGLGLARQFTINRLLLYSATAGALVATLLYCGSFLLESFD